MKTEKMEIVCSWCNETLIVDISKVVQAEREFVDLVEHHAKTKYYNWRDYGFGKSTF